MSIQDQMEQYINDLVTIDAIVQQPEFFWLRDFRSFVAKIDGVAYLDFNAQIDAFLSHPVYSKLYSDHIVRDISGKVTSSRCIIYMDNVDIEDVKDQVHALQEQRAITEAEPINKGLSDYLFFTYDRTYNIWEFYEVLAEQIVSNTIYSVAAVTGVALLWMPHWTAAVFVLPLISVLYIELLGVLQWAGVSINPVSYVSLVMSIGLLVDYIMHALLRYYELPGNRREKTVMMLKTMGSSILIGAITTFLGTLPLAFSTSDIFHTIFIAFLGLVALGASHGLILLPVILSIIGPEDQVIPSSTTTTKSKSQTKIVEEQPVVTPTMEPEPDEVVA
jgi:Niemann-Pick C1 protein